MIIVIALAVLAIADCVCGGFRAAAGTDGRLDKRAYYRGAIVRALVGASTLVGAHALLVGALVLSSSDPALAWSMFLDAGRICVVVYGAFASVVATAFAFYFAPIADVRVLTNVIVFGPLTILRPYIIVGGLVLAVATTGDVRVGIVATSAAISMLSFQSIIGRRHADRWRLLLEL